jgi:hypothetical protein
MIRALIGAIFRPAIIFPIPTGMTPDQAGALGLLGLMQNVNNYSESLSSVASTGNVVNLIAASAQVAGNFLSGFVMINAGATAGVTVNLPSTQNLIANLGNTIPLDGSYSEPVHIVNNSGQTATLTAADANTTILGSAAVVTGNVRKFMLRVLNSSNVSITNVGTWTF